MYIPVHNQDLSGYENISSVKNKRVWDCLFVLSHKQENRMLLIALFVPEQYIAVFKTQTRSLWGIASFKIQLYYSFAS